MDQILDASYDFSVVDSNSLLFVFKHAPEVAKELYINSELKFDTVNQSQHERWMVLFWTSVFRVPHEIWLSSEEMCHESRRHNQSCLFLKVDWRFLHLRMQIHEGNSFKSNCSVWWFCNLSMQGLCVLLFLTLFSLVNVFEMQMYMQKYAEHYVFVACSSLSMCYRVLAEIAASNSSAICNEVLYRSDSCQMS